MISFPLAATSFSDEALVHPQTLLIQAAPHPCLDTAREISGLLVSIVTNIFADTPLTFSTTGKIATTDLVVSL